MKLYKYLMQVQQSIDEPGLAHFNSDDMGLTRVWRNEHVAQGTH